MTKPKTEPKTLQSPDIVVAKFLSFSPNQTTTMIPIAFKKIGTAD